MGTIIGGLLGGGQPQQGGQAGGQQQQGWYVHNINKSQIMTVTLHYKTHRMPYMLRMVMMYYVVNIFMKQWRGGNETPTPQVDKEGNALPVEITQLPHAPLWKQNIPYSLRYNTFIHYQISYHILAHIESIYQKTPTYFP